MTIHIEDLTFSTIIGILDFERVTPQKIIINSKISYDYKCDNFINYADVIQLIQDKCSQKKYGLLEDALEDIITSILKEYKEIKEIYLKITKPDIIENAKVSLAISIKN
jgi:dihydroneopterin aldolase